MFGRPSQVRPVEVHLCEVCPGEVCPGEEVTGSVTMTCHYCGISQPTLYKRRNRNVHNRALQELTNRANVS